MTPKVERHVAAIVDLLRAATPTIPVGLGVAPSDPMPYLLVRPDSGDVARDRLCGERANLTLRFEVEAAADGPEQCLWAMDAARAALVGVRLTVAGAVVAPIDQIDGSRLYRGQTIQPAIYTIDAEFRLFSQAVT